MTDGSDGWHQGALTTRQRERIAETLREDVPAERLGAAIAEAERMVLAAVALEADGLNALPRDDGYAEDLADLERLRDAAEGAEREELEREIGELLEEAKRAKSRTGPRVDHAARVLVDLAAQLWERETGRRCSIQSGSERSPWERFALALADVAGLEAAGIKLPRGYTKRNRGRV